MIAKEMIQNWDIREVCVDCKHLYQYDELIGDEEFTYFGCHENGCVTCHGEDYPELECENKVKEDNLLFDEKKDKEWEQNTKKKIEQFFTMSICPYCEHTCDYSFTEERCKQEINEVLSEIKHGTCVLKIE